MAPWDPGGRGLVGGGGAKGSGRGVACAALCTQYRTVLHYVNTVSWRTV
jgi:hypothetical protein